MKRCPECRRDYYDETLLYCLDDGNALLDGPASGASSSGDEPATEILHETSAPSEAATRAQIHTTEQTAVLASNKDPIGPSAGGRKYALIIAIAAILVAGGAFGYYKFIASRGAVVSFERAKFDRVTHSGEINFAVISTDGKWLAYNFYISGLQESIRFQQVGVADTSKEIVPASEIAVDAITFSPEGKYIYYVARDKSDGYVKSTLYQIPFLGGPAKRVLNDISGKVAFSPKDDRIVYNYIAPGENQTEGVETRLMIANADGTDQNILATRGGNEFLGSEPAWSPDGKSIVATYGTIEPRVTSLVTVSPETGEITPFTATGRFHTIDQPTWLSDGNSLLVLAKEKSWDQPKIWQISYPSGEVRKVASESTNPGTYYVGLSLDSDSSTLATTEYTDRTTFWTASTSDPTAATELKLGTDVVTRPAWTPDGKIVFAKYSGDASELYITDPQGGTPKPLTSNGGATAPDVSPDGRYIVFNSDRTGVTNLWRIDIDGGNPKPLTTTGTNFGPSISPDGRYVYYTCNANRLDKICKVGIDGGPPVQLTTYPSSNPQISADGKRILCYYREKLKAPLLMAIIPAEGGPPIKTFPKPESMGFAPRWMPGDYSFFYSTAKEYISNLWIQPIDGGPAKQYTNLTSLYIPWADFSRDSRIVYSRASSVADVVLISGFKK